MSTKVGSIYYDLDLDDKEFNKKSDKASTKFEGLGEKVKSTGIAVAKATGAAMLAAGTAIAGVATASIKHYADYEQMTGGVEKLFEESAQTVIKNSKEAYQTAGMDANTYMNTVTGFSARLLQSLGGDTVKAAQIADMAVRDMGDNANVFGTNIEDITNAYQGFAKGNFTMLDNLKLGYGGTASEMARLINDSGVMGKTFTATAQNINSVGFDKYIEAINIVQQRQNITGTTAKEAAETISGSIGSAKAAWTNLLTSFGTGDVAEVSKAMDSLGTAVGNVFRNISEVIPAIIEGMVTAVSQLPKIDLSGIIAKIVEQLPQIVKLAVDLVKSLVNGIKENLPMLVNAAIEIITTLVTGIIELLPVIIEVALQLIIALIQGIAQALPQLMSTIVDTVLTIVDVILDNLPLLIEAGITILIAVIQGLVEAIPKLIEKVPFIIESIVSTIIRLLPQIIVAAIRIIIELGKGLIAAIPRLIVMIPQIIIAIVAGLINDIGEIEKVGRSLVEGLWNGIKNAGNWIKNQIRSWIGDVLSFMKRIFGIKSPSKVMEKQIGFNLGAGIAKGIEDSIGLVEEAMGDVSSAVEREITPVVNSSISPLLNQGSFDYHKGNSPQKVVNQDIDVNVGQVNDQVDMESLANLLGFKVNTMPI